MQQRERMVKKYVQRFKVTADVVGAWYDEYKTHRVQVEEYVGTVTLEKFFQGRHLTFSFFVQYKHKGESVANIVKDVMNRYPLDAQYVEAVNTRKRTNKIESALAKYTETQLAKPVHKESFMTLRETLIGEEFAQKWDTLTLDQRVEETKLLDKGVYIPPVKVNRIYTFEGKYYEGLDSVARAVSGVVGLELNRIKGMINRGYTPDRTCGHLKLEQHHVMITSLLGGRETSKERYREYIKLNLPLYTIPLYMEVYQATIHDALRVIIEETKLADKEDAQLHKGVLYMSLDACQKSLGFDMERYNESRSRQDAPLVSILFASSMDKTYEDFRKRIGNTYKLY